MKLKITLIFFLCIHFFSKGQCPPVTGFEICGVTADTGGTHMIIIWDKTNFAQVDTFLIHRETSTQGVYTLVGKVPYDSLSWFHDYGADPAVAAYRYKVGVIDTCGNRFDTLSPYHLTPYFFQQSPALFVWNYYTLENAANPVINFILERDSLSNGIWDSIGMTAGSQNVLVDVNEYNNPNTHPFARWRLGMNWNRACVAAFRMAHRDKTQSIPVYMISNINSDHLTGMVEKKAENRMILFPNPAKDQINISSMEALGWVTVYNPLGEIVLQTKSKNKQEQIDVSKLPFGIYTVIADNLRTKFIKE